MVVSREFQLEMHPTISVANEQGDGIAWLTIGMTRAKANAQLIAAAPDMLAALKYASVALDCDEGVDFHEDETGKRWHPTKCPACRVRDAIKKAEGDK